AAHRGTRAPSLREASNDDALAGFGGPRCSLWVAPTAQQSGLCGGCNRHARARHWRECGDFYSGTRGVAQAAAGAARSRALQFGRHALVLRYDGAAAELRALLLSALSRGARRRARIHRDRSLPDVAHQPERAPRGWWGI